MKVKKPRILFFDIETTPLLAWVWGLGKQRIYHGQLHKARNMYDIICITYCWNDGKPAKALTWGYKEQDSGPMINKFDNLVQQADIVIGKNSDRFDIKHINTQRMLAGLPGMPNWSMYSDDLEKQLRRHFAVPSQSLDYWSELLGLGGKIKMDFQHWIDIVEQTPGKGRKAFNQMVTYGKKDTEDTRALWLKLEKHFTPRHNLNVLSGGCKICGSDQLKPSRKRHTNNGVYREFYCREHDGYAGRSIIKKKGELGAIK